MFFNNKSNPENRDVGVGDDAAVTDPEKLLFCESGNGCDGRCGSISLAYSITCVSRSFFEEIIKTSYFRCNFK